MPVASTLQQPTKHNQVSEHKPREAAQPIITKCVDSVSCNVLWIKQSCGKNRCRSVLGLSTVQGANKRWQQDTESDDTVPDFGKRSKFDLVPNDMHWNHPNTNKPVHMGEQSSNSSMYVRAVLRPRYNAMMRLKGTSPLGTGRRTDPPKDQMTKRDNSNRIKSTTKP